MMNFTRKNSLLILIILLGSFCTAFLSTNASTTTLNKSGTQSYALPFNGFYLHYQLKAQKDTSPLFSIDLNINYSLLSGNSSNTYNYQQKMIIKSYLLSFINENQENATFYENGSNRLIEINSTEGNYITWFIYDAFALNSSYGAKNWDPFWIIPRDVINSYPIYSLNVNLTKRTNLGPSDIALFNQTRPVLVFNAIQNIITTSENITNSIGLIYDNYTGILLKGVLDSIVRSASTSHHYYVNFELKDSNGFAVFPPFTTSTTSTPPQIIPLAFQKPNYFLLAIIFVLPGLITIIRFLRLKEISGGLE